MGRINVYNIILVFLVVLPFYELLFRVLPYVSAIVPDTRAPKEMAAIWAFMAVGLTGIYRGTIRPCGNIYMLLFFGILLISIRLAPKMYIEINHIDSTNFWVWRESFYLLCCFLAFHVISGISWTKQKVFRVFKVMAVCATVMSVYVVLQKFGFEQFFHVKPYEKILHAPNPNLIGTLGNPTLVAAYIAVLLPVLFCSGIKGIPFVFCLFFIVLALWFTQSEAAILTAVLGIIGYFCFINPKLIFLAVIVLTVSGTIYLKVAKSNFYTELNKLVLQDNGRFTQWEKIYKQIKEEKYDNDGAFPLFGAGPGSFAYLYPSVTKSGWKQAHNEYIEIMFKYGIFGLLMFLMIKLHILWCGIAGLLKIEIKKERKIIACLLSSFLAVCVISLFTFYYHLGAHVFYAVIIAGLLSNKNILEGKYENENYNGRSVHDVIVGDC